MIRQSVTALTYSPYSGGPAACHAEDVDVGVLPDGAYAVILLYPASQAPLGVALSTPSQGYIVWYGGFTQCSTPPRFIVSPLPPTTGQSFTLTRIEAMTLPPYPAATVHVSGNEIRVDDFVPTEFPVDCCPVRCGQSAVKLTLDTPGQYFVHWYQSDHPSSPIGSFDLQVVEVAPLLDAQLVGALFLVLAIAGTWILRR